MGVLSDLVLAKESELAKIGESQVPSRDFRGIDIKGIDTVKFGTLDEILTGKSFEETLEDYDPVLEVSQDGPWVFRVPSSVVTGLAELDEAGRKEVAAKWAATEEFEDWEPQQVSRALDEIAALAREGNESGLTMFLWMCL